MSEWTSCPQCGLKHSLRADGLCPRCRTEVGAATVSVAAARTFTAPPSTPVEENKGGTLYGGGATLYAGGSSHDGNVYAPPRASLAAPPVAVPSGPPKVRTYGPDEVPLGARLAGLVLVLNGIGLLIEAGTGAKTGSPPASAFVDLLVGGFLLAGVAKTLAWAKVRAGLGAIVLPLFLLSQGNALMAGFQVAFSVALLALLVGNAGKLRIGVAMSFLGLYMALEIIGLLSAGSPVRPEPGAESTINAPFKSALT